VFSSTLAVKLFSSHPVWALITVHFHGMIMKLDQNQNHGGAHLSHIPLIPFIPLMTLIPEDIPRCHTTTDGDLVFAGLY